MARPRITLLDPAEVERIQGTSLRILAEVGVHVPHAGALERLGRVGAEVDRGRAIARLPERVVLDAVAAAGKQYVLHGRAPERVARYGYGEVQPHVHPGPVRLVRGADRAAARSDPGRRAGGHHPRRCPAQRDRGRGRWRSLSTCRPRSGTWS